jgi:C1A family cysteine protease
MRFQAKFYMFKLLVQSRRRFPTFLTFAIIYFLLLTSITFSQSIERKYSFGALVLSKEEYDKIPRPNWDTLKKYANLKAISSESTKSFVHLTNPPIGNQGNQGSCVGWATGYAALGTLTYSKYSCWDLASRSPSYVFNQIQLGNCSSAYLTNGLDLVKNQGSCSLSLMPYNPNECSTQPNSTQIYEASRHNATNYYAINPTTDVDEIIDAIDLGYPIPCSFDVYESFIETWEDDGVWDVEDSGEYQGHHAVCIVGYDNVQEMLLIQNSVLTPQIAGHNLKNKLGLIKFGNYDNNKKEIYT